MTALFPWALGGPLSLYLGLYVITLAIHAVFVGYVLAGTGWVAVASVRRTDDPIADTARDWLPFALGAAITAGVAPLLFVQILYQERFYTSNLLLFHRWMAVVPVLIAGFYLLYLNKAKPRAWAAIGAAACFVFVAWSWTENHLLGLDDREWIAFYGERRWFYDSPALIPRLVAWVAAAMPIFAAAVSWQRRAPRRGLALFAITGVVISTAAALWQYRELPDASRFDLDQPMIAPWWWVFGAARGAELFAWIACAVRPSKRALASATAGGAIAIVAGAMLREGARLHALELLRPRAIAAGGAIVFFAFAALTIAALIAIYKIVRRGLTSPT
ncbi:MAG TPA: hypothetical protein VL463_20235 [Kofleriaceae bacterium]|nr:hypothetical protein [Kofleriaceae bacterium]